MGIDLLAFITNDWFTNEHTRLIPHADIKHFQDSIKQGIH